LSDIERQYGSAKLRQIEKYFNVVVTDGAPLSNISDEIEARRQTRVRIGLGDHGTPRCSGR